MSILDHFLRPANKKKTRRDLNTIEKHFMPKGEKKGDLFTALKATEKPGQKQLVHGPKAIPLMDHHLRLMSEIIDKYGPEVDYATIAKYYTEPVAKFLTTVWNDGRAVDTKQWRLSDDQVTACKRIFGEDHPACDPQNVLGKMFAAKKSTWLKSYKYWSGQK